jgi:hypothetical protein
MKRLRDGCVYFGEAGQIRTLVPCTSHGQQAWRYGHACLRATDKLVMIVNVPCRQRHYTASKTEASPSNVARRCKHGPRIRLALLFLLLACSEARGSHQQRRANPQRRLYTNSLAVSHCPAIAVPLLTAVPSNAFAAAVVAAAAGWLGLVVVQKRLPITPALPPAAAKAKRGERAVAKRADLPCVRVSVRETESARWAQQ